ncbi:MAG: RHS repeat domain-containing protein [Pseudobdellovibrionaceae bacterium]
MLARRLNRLVLFCATLLGLFFSSVKAWAGEWYDYQIAEYNRCYAQAQATMAAFKADLPPGDPRITFSGFLDTSNMINSIVSGGGVKPDNVTYTLDDGVYYYYRIYVAGYGYPGDYQLNDALGKCSYPQAVNQRSKSIRPPIRPRNQCGSIIGVDDLSLGEQIPIPGTSWSFNYSSARSRRALDYTVNIPLVDSTMPAGLKSVSVNIELWNTFKPIVGSNTGLIIFPVTSIATFNFAAVPNLSFNYTWNGKNEAGQIERNQRLLRINKQFTYNDGTKRTDADFVYIGSYDAQAMSLGGWTFSEQHFLDRVSNRIHLGNGQIQNVDLSVPAVLTREFSAGTFFTVGYHLPSEDNQLIYNFDKDGYHISTQHALTLKTLLTFNYDTSKRLTSVVDAFGHSYQIVRSAAGFDFVTWTGRKTQVKINANNLASEFILPDNTSYKITYQANSNLMTGYQKPSGALSTFSYNAKGELIKDQTGNAFSAFTTTGNIFNKVITMATALGRKTQVAIDQDYTISQSNIGYRRTETRPDGFQITTYDNENQSLQINAGDNSSTFEWAEDSLLKSNYKTISYERKVYPNILSYDKSNVVTKNRVIRVTSDEDPFDLKALQIVSSISTGITQRTTSSAYDRATNKYTYTSGQNRISKVYLNSFGQVIKEEIPNVTAMEYIYDVHGRISQLKQGARVYTFSYDANNDLVQVKNPLGQITKFEYDVMGRRIKTTWPDGLFEQYAYDTGGRRTKVTPVQKPVHSFVYNVWDFVTQYTPALLATAENIYNSFAYDNDKSLVSIRRADGRVIKNTYDPVTGQITRQQTTEKIIDYTYAANDPDGFYYSLNDRKMISKNNQTGLEQNTYYDPDTGTEKVAQLKAPGLLDNAQDLNYNLKITRQGLSLGGAYISNLYLNNNFNTKSLDYTRNNDDQITKANEMTLAYQSSNGQLSRTTLGRVSQLIGYDAFGDISYKSFIYAKPASKDANGNTIPAQNIVVYDQRYTRDSLGRVTGITEINSGITTQKAFTYDLRGRLYQSLLGTALQRQYSYDGNGNRVSLLNKPTNVTSTYKVDEQDRLTQAGNDVLSYSLQGELLQKKDLVTSAIKSKYQFDSYGQLTSSWQNGSTISYVYDNRQRRLARQKSGKITNRYVWLSDTQLLAQINGQGQVDQFYVYATRSHVPDFMYKGSSILMLITDHVGSVRKVIDSQTGQVVQDLDYDEFGNVTKDTNPGYQPFGFAGGLYDPDTKMVKFGARTYDPSIGRWISKDPILFDGGDGNLYGYVGNDPVNFVDPTGLITTKDIINNGRKGLTLGIGVGLFAGFVTANPGTGFAVGLATGLLYAGYLSADQIINESFQNQSQNLTPIAPIRMPANNNPNQTCRP